MGDAGKIKLPHVGLQTAEHEEILNIIDTLRSHGISRYVDLPQLVVCGDQSSGKSSVLEAISGLRFPTKDNLCTRFATELILRRGQTPTISVSITPGDDCTEKEAEALQAFKPPSTCIDDFSTIVQAAEKAMGLDGGVKKFSNDVLRVELCGPDQPHLTLVDLPGIFWAGDKLQSDDDASIVRSMVESYMKKSRSIILAVVSAKSDLAMQVVTKLAREIDPAGNRTLGIITKPDTLYAGSDSEVAFVKLAKNENIPFKLGWHVLKNRDYDTKDATTAERDQSERTFFEDRIWSTAVPLSQLGISNLRPRLSNVLLNQILRELPNLTSDVQKGIERSKLQLEAIGGPRSSLSEQRTYLLQASRTFETLMTDAVHGRYTNAFFGDAETNQGYSKRLRSVVQAAMKAFAERMRKDGHAVCLTETDPSPSACNQSEVKPNPMSRSEFLSQVERKMARNRGSELPGLFNPDIIADLFGDQSKPWQRILNDSLLDLQKAAESTISLVLQAATDKVTFDAILGHIIRPRFELVKAQLVSKVEEVLEPHLSRRLSTYNHYFTDNLQKKRQEGAKKVIAARLKSHFGGSEGVWYGNSVDLTDLLNTLTLDTEVDMSRFAAIEATNAMEAYYQVALKNVIDAYSIYAVETSFLLRLTDIFTPTVVYELGDDFITKIAAESSETTAERTNVNRKLKVLEQTMSSLQRLRPMNILTLESLDDSKTGSEG
ncbi:hypothetical protein PV10_02921 [Exophiala mesophila]|uniref:GED domain-containing protein n=1 Tax=Exophiala mesophila TaxID=212818 RepID=A0A0D1Y3L5_EXOME|nr:uncharacterized protein PV10_02921 [Exophiala mesophila]KIV95246.1 hypothetical protein PV10_02921 [Exophiala mesophila]